MGLRRQWATRIGERLDAVGSPRRLSAVEPADWKVTLVASFGLGLVVLGAFVALLALLG